MSREDRSFVVPILEGASGIEVKKSRFLCAVKNVCSEEAALSFVEEIRHSYPDARHHCYAFRTGSPELCKERFSDDGEPQGTAGRPMLAILQGRELYDVCVVVTRYFGGTLLGTGGLVKAYSDAVKEALDGSVCIALREGIRMTVDADYTASEKIKFALRKAGVCIEKEEYGSSVLLHILVPLEQKNSVETSVRELSAGRILCVPEEEVLFGENNGPYIYRVTKYML